MNIITVPVGYLSTNCYFLVKENNCLIVDPGDNSAMLIDMLEKQKLNVQAILLTHSHYDHIGALEDLLTFCKTDVYKMENLKEGKKTIKKFKFEVIYTPGHTDDSITYYFQKEKLMLTGDFLFKETIGRYDLETSSFLQMKQSISKIKKYDDDITICPGHGKRTNLAYEKENNSYLKAY